MPVLNYTVVTYLLSKSNTFSLHSPTSICCQHPVAVGPEAGETVHRVVMHWGGGRAPGQVCRSGLG